jgi:Ca-activated chloride channel family protein
MTVGDRKIRGIIREREEAEKIYKEARSQGYVASLLTQERPNIFTQSVANIEPGKAIDINIRYFNTLAYMDGAYEFVFPMVVGPRFNPPGQTDGIGAVAHGSAGVSGQKTEVQYLKPGTRSGHDISVNIDIDAGVKIEKIDCINHVVRHTWHGPERATVVLSDLDAIPNKDFVLRYKVAGDRVKSGLITHRDARGGFFTLMVFPPAELASLQRAPVELVFVLDSSGSMNGQPIAQAKRAIERGLRLMQPDDTFQLINFSNNASQLGPAPLAASRKNIQRGLDYLASLNGEGGTMMIEGIKAALDFPHDPKRLRFVVFCTDGYIGNEAEIFGEVHNRLRDSRIFSFGVGTSVNRYLLDGLARLGRGAVAYLSLNENATPVMDTFFERISHPAMTDLVADWGGLQVTDVYPHKLHDLFVGRPMIITGRFKGTPAGTIRIKGKASRPVPGPVDQDAEITIPVSDSESSHAGLAAVWARMKIADLSARSTYEGGNELPGEIKNVALEFGLMSRFTSFVAVDSLSKTVGDHGTTVAVPVPMPDGVKYETTVQE